MAISYIICRFFILKTTGCNKAYVLPDRKRLLQPKYTYNSHQGAGSFTRNFNMNLCHVWPCPKDFFGESFLLLTYRLIPFPPTPKYWSNVCIKLPGTRN